MSSSEGVGALTLVLPDVVETRPAVQTRAGRTRVRFTWGPEPRPVRGTRGGLEVTGSGPLHQDHLTVPTEVPWRSEIRSASGLIEELGVIIRVRTHFTVLPGEAVGTHAMVAARLLLTGPSVPTGT